jgi:hypothetical protein
MNSLLKSSEGLMQVALGYWQAVQQRFPGSIEVADMLSAFQAEAEEREARGDALSLVFKAPFQEPGSYVAAIGFTQWCASGFPVVEMGEKFLASLLVSSIDGAMLEELHRPWPAFIINVPGNMLEFDDDGRSVFVRRVLVATTPGKFGDWSFLAMPGGLDDVGSLYRYCCPATKLHEELPREDKESRFGLPFDLALTSKDERTSALVGKLVLATCAALSMQELVTEVGRAHAGYAAAKRDPERYQKMRVFRLGKPISLDFRPRVSAYVKGERVGSKLEVQSVVRGHFKRQHHGPKNALVKTIWRQPYWRGPEESPVLVRSHVVKETK